MKKIIFFLALIAASRANSQSLVNAMFSDSTLYGVHWASGSKVWDRYAPVYKLYRKSDSVFYRAGGLWVFAYKDSSGSGLSNPMTSTGDLIISSDNSGTPARLSIGSNTYVLTSNGTTASWQPPSSSGWGLTGNASTNSGSNYLGTSDNISLAIRTNATERFRIDSVGKLFKFFIQSSGDYYTHGLEINSANLGTKAWINVDGSNDIFFSKGTGQPSSFYAGSWKNPSNGFTITLDYQGAYTNAGTPLSAGGAPSNASAIFEANSTTKGFLMPRMTATQAEAISSPAEGLLIYSTNGTGSTITSKGWWGYDGTNWVKLN